MKQKINKNEMYRVVFTHCLETDNKIEHTVFGREVYRLRNLLSNFGYQQTNIEEVTR